METFGRPSTSWKAMLERTNSLVAPIITRDDGIPPLQRDPTQLQAAAQKLLKGQVANQPSDNRAVRLLGQVNFDVDKLERDLHQIAPKTSYDPTDSYNHHDRIIHSTIDEALVATRTESDLQFQLNVEEDWENSKRELLEDHEHESNGTWGALQHEDGSTFKAQKMSPSNSFPVNTNLFYQPHAQKSLLPSSEGIAARRDSRVAHDGGAVHQMTPRMLSYSNVVEMTRSDSVPTASLVAQFQKTVGTFSDAGAAGVSQLWEATRFITTSVASSNGSTSALVGSHNQRHQQPPSSRDQTMGARKFLESQYKLFIDRHLQYSSGSAMSSDLESSVRHWLRLSRDQPMAGLSRLSASLAHDYGEPRDLVEGDLPLWAVVYYCMRCGGWSTAANILLQANKLNKLQTSDFKVVEGLQQLASKYDSPEPTGQSDWDVEDVRALRDSISAEGECSPWRRVVVQLIAGDDNVAQNGIIQTSVEDYFWFKLCAVLSEDNSYSIRDLAAMVFRVGPDHFNASSDPYLYARLLLMCQDHEQAVAFLATRGFEAMTDAVHLAIALNSSGLLRLGRSSLKSSDTDPEGALPGSVYLVPRSQPGVRSRFPEDDRQSALVPAGEVERQPKEGEELVSALDFGLLIQQYVRRFAQNDPGRAVLYILQLRSDDPAEAPALEEKVKHLLSALLLESRDLGALLDGSHRSFRANTAYSHPREGILYRRLKDDERCLDIVAAAAREASEQGFPEVAYELYLRGRMPEDLGNAIQILNNNLSQLIAPSTAYRTGDVRERERWMSAAGEMEQQARMGHLQAQSQAIETSVQSLQQMMNIVRFFDQFHSNAMSNPDKWNKALGLVRSLLPQSKEECMGKLENLRQLGKPVQSVINAIVLAAMTCLVNSYNERKQLVDTGKMKMLQEQVKALIQFAAKLDLNNKEAEELNRLQSQLE